MSSSTRISAPMVAQPPSTMSPCRTWLLLWTRLRRYSQMDQYSRDGSPGKPEGDGLRRRVRILLADDHTMFREGLTRLLTSSYEEEVEVVGKTMIGEEAVAL